MLNKLTELEKTQIYKQMFDYINSQHLQLLSSLDHVRSICNYVLVGLLAFTGLLFQNSQTSELLLNNDIRKIILITLLFIVFCLYFIILRTLNINLGFDAELAVSVIDNEIEIDAKIVQKNLMKNAKSQYRAAKASIDKVFIIKDYFLVISFLFIIILLIFISTKSINIYV